MLNRLIVVKEARETQTHEKKVVNKKGAKANLHGHRNEGVKELVQLEFNKKPIAHNPGSTGATVISWGSENLSLIA